VYSKKDNRSFLYIEKSWEVPIRFSLQERVDVSVITYSYHNIIIFLTYASAPNKVYYLTFERPRGNDLIYRKNLSLKFNYVPKNESFGELTELQMPFENYYLSRMVAHGSDKSIAV